MDAQGSFQAALWRASEAARHPAGMAGEQDWGVHRTFPVMPTSSNDLKGEAVEDLAAPPLLWWVHWEPQEVAGPAVWGRASGGSFSATLASPVYTSVTCHPATGRSCPASHPRAATLPSCKQHPASPLSSVLPLFLCCFLKFGIRLCLFLVGQTSSIFTHLVLPFVKLVMTWASLQEAMSKATSKAGFIFSIWVMSIWMPVFDVRCGQCSTMSGRWSGCRGDIEQK